MKQRIELKKACEIYADMVALGQPNKHETKEAMVQIVRRAAEQWPMSNDGPDVLGPDLLALVGP